MAMRQLIVREHERIAISDGGGGEKYITTREFDLLVRLCEKNAINPFTPGYRSIKFAQFCGVIQVAGLSIEILPKVANNDGYDRLTLLQMLAMAGDFPVRGLHGHDMELQQVCLLPALARWFCDELFTQCHQGLVRSYVTQQEDLSVIRGRWLPALDIQRFPGRKDRLNCEFDELTPDNAHNRILKAALRRVKNLFPGHAKIRRDVDTLLAWFSDVADVEATRESLKHLPTNRLTARYRHALLMAEWFLTDRSPNISSGKSDALSLLFDMNALFQALLGRAIRRVLPPDLAIREEGPRYFLTRGHDGISRFQMKPDFCVLRGKTIVAVIDAKWKRLEPEDRSGKWGISQSDVYQLGSYSSAYDCPRVALLYPSHPGLEDIATRPSFNFLTHGDALAGPKLMVDWLPLEHGGGWTRWSVSIERSVLAALNRMDLLGQDQTPAVAN
jgi:5-methylcytosine-specific restriction enzyme subunit McrC